MKGFLKIKLKSYVKKMSICGLMDNFTKQMTKTEWNSFKNLLYMKDKLQGPRRYKNKGSAQGEN